MPAGFAPNADCPNALPEDVPPPNALPLPPAAPPPKADGVLPPAPAAPNAPLPPPLAAPEAGFVPNPLCPNAPVPPPLPLADPNALCPNAPPPPVGTGFAGDAPPALEFVPARTAASENESGRGPPTTDPAGYRASWSFSASRVVADKDERADLIMLSASFRRRFSSVTWTWRVSGRIGRGISGYDIVSNTVHAMTASGETKRTSHTKSEATPVGPSPLTYPCG